jgi:hypothetical protein
VHGVADLIRAVGSLWPLALLAVLVWFRRPVGQALAALGEGLRIRRLKAGPFEAEFWREAYETRASLDAPDVPSAELAETVADPESLVARFGDLAMAAPAVAILRAHSDVEEALRQKLRAADPEVDVDRIGASMLARRALKAGLIAAKVVPAVEGITVLRNLAANRNQDEVTRDQAREYLALADGVMYALSQPPRR